AAIALVRPALHDERDRALASDIATGVQRWRAALDHLIAQFSKRSVERLDPEVVEILRLSAYQLLHLTRVPASAVVDDAVDLTRRKGKPSAAGFVNAVLRTISRQRHALPLPPRAGLHLTPWSWTKAIPCAELGPLRDGSSSRTRPRNWCRSWPARSSARASSTRARRQAGRPPRSQR